MPSAIAPWEGAFPYLWLDAKHLKVRDRGSVRSKAPVIAYAVHESGRREVIGIDLGETETEAFWWPSCAIWWPGGSRECGWRSPMSTRG
jgi:transposase-like protein